MHTFYIELSKITESEEKVGYPRCTKCAGEIQKPKKAILKAEEFLEPAEEVIDETDEFFNEDNINFDEGNINLGDSFYDNKFI